MEWKDSAYLKGVQVKANILYRYITLRTFRAS